MKTIKLYTLLILILGYTNTVKAQDVAAFCGGEMYQNIEQSAIKFKHSGFNTAILWSVHIMPNGDFVLNDSKIIANGEYVGKDGWPAAVRDLKEEPTSVNRVEFSIGAWGVPDFENIESLINAEGTGETSRLYRNFKKLKEITGADAIDYDDESNYDVASTVKLSEMLIDMGYKITLCPYTRKSFWQSVFDQVEGNHPGAIDRVYLQCYAGGAYNTPASWNGLFGELKVSPGLWCSHGTNCMSGLDYIGVKNKLNTWKNEMNGAFMWSFDGILQCSIGGSPKKYAKSIREVMGMEAKMTGKAYQPHPADSSVEVSVDDNLSWIAGSWDASHKLYFSTDSVFTESASKGTFDKAEYEPGTLENNTTYYWRVDETNDVGTVKGELWQFTTELVTLPAEKATNPVPENSQEGIDVRPTLSWTTGNGHVSHKVYFGSVNPPPFAKEQTDTFYIPGKLESKTTYYWRIDETNSSGSTEGDTWSFTTQDKNIAPEASISVSTEYSSSFGKNKVIDGVVKVHGEGEWASNGEITPWIKLTWTEDKNIAKIVLYDRANGVDAIQEGVLTFSDGTSIQVGELPNDGTPLEITVDNKTVSWMKFEVTSGSGSNVGLSEIEVIEADEVVGVSDVETGNLVVMPNPVSTGVFRLSLPSNNNACQLYMYNSDGIQVKSIDNFKYGNTINIQELPKGVYLIQTKNKKSIFVTKIVKL